MKFAVSACAVATTVAVAVFGSTATAAVTSVSSNSQSHRTLGFMECPDVEDGIWYYRKGDAYMTTTDDSVEFGSCTEGGGSFTVNEGVTVDYTDDSIMISVTAKDGTESSLALYDDSVVVVWGVEDMPDLTINDPVYNYTNDIGSYLGIESDDTGDDDGASSESSDESGEDGSPSSDDDAEEGFLVIIGSTEECEVYMLAFNADAVITASPTDDCGFVTMATDDFVAMGNDKDYISFMEDSVMFGSYTGSSFTIEGMTSEQTDAGDTVLTTDEGTMTFTAEGTVVFASTDPEADVLTMMNPVYSYTEDPGAFTITGDTEDCAGYFVAFNQDGSMFGSEECDFFVLATDDFITLGNEDAYISIREDSVMYGSVVTGSNFTMENVIEQKKNGDIVVSMDGVPGYASFNADGSFVSNDGTADVLKILNTVYSYTEGDDGGFVITGNTKECADFFLMFNNDGFSYGSEACDLLVLATDDVVVIGNGDAYISMLEDSVMFGSSVTGSNFTIDGITSEANDDGDMVMSYEGGSSTFASDGSIVYTPTDSDADGSTLMNAVYTYTEEGDGGFVISGNTKDCDDFTYAFNADGVIMGSEDCGFLAGGDAEGGYVVTDDFIAFGNEDAFIAFAEDSVTFGSSSTGAKFTIDADVTETDDEGIMMSYDGGSTTFTADNTIVHVLGSDDPDAATITINNPVYDYTGDVFIISGDTKDCADLTLAFNAEGGLMGSKECGFLLKKSNEDAYIGFAEDSVMFGSYSTGSKFTIDADVTEIDEDIMMSYEGGSTTFAADNTVVLASSDPDADTLTINNPVYDYKDDAFIISGDIEGCDDFSLAFNNDGVVSGSKDCGFIAGGNEDGWMYASDDKIAVGNNEGSSEVLLNFGDDDGSCKTIRELLCESPAADSYTTVCELWTNSETVKSNEGVSMTVFVPTDDAFATLNDLLDQADVVLDSEANEKILMFHATPGMVMSTDLGCTGRLEMFNSGYSRTKCGRANKIDYLIQKGSGNRKNDMEPIIIAADIMACDESVIHIVSEVMLPNFIEDLA